MRRRSDAERLYLVVRHLSRRLRDVDVLHNVSPARFSTLVHLAFHGVDNIGQLAAHERVSRPSMTRLVRDMEADGLVRRRPDRNDGRGVLVQLTKKGREVVRRVRTGKIALVEDELARLNGNQRKAVRAMLDAMQKWEELN